MREKRPREFGIVFSIDEATTIDGFVIGPNGQLSLTRDGAPISLASAAVEVAYDRPKGRKVLLRAPLDVDAPSVDPNAHLLRYWAVFAVDTNTRAINGSAVSVACVLRSTRKETDAGLFFEEIPIGAYELHNVRCNPERLAWRLLCNEILQAPDYKPEKTIGIIVDAHLEALSDINRRTAPVVGDWYLPEGFTLIYASDAAAESIPNQLIRSCDREASIILKKIAQGETKGPPQEAPDSEYYSHFRFWSRNATPTVR